MTYRLLTGFARLGCAAAVALGCASVPANALDGSPFKGSREGWKRGDSTSRKILGFIVGDPIGPSILSIDDTLFYDVDEWIFRPDQSGFFCGFSLGADCPPANAFYGSEIMRTVNAFPGDIAPGGVFTLAEPNPGEIRLSANFSIPVTVDVDTNYFAYAFEPINLDLSRPTRIAYFEGDEGTSFESGAFSCTAVGGATCGSSTPVGSVTVSAVPAPPALMLALTGFAALGAASRVVKRRNGC